MADGESEKAQGGAARAACGVCMILRAETKPGADEEFAALMGDFAHRVRAEEQGCLAYVVTRAIGVAGHFAVHARFLDWAAFKAHAGTDHMAHALPRVTAHLATPVTMELFLEV